VQNSEKCSNSDGCGRLAVHFTADFLVEDIFMFLNINEMISYAGPPATERASPACTMQRTLQLAT